MRGRSILTMVLWAVVAILLIRSCLPKSTPPDEIVTGFVPETFDPPDAPPEKDFVLETDLLRTKWTNRGAGCTEVDLKDFHPGSLDGGGGTVPGEKDWLRLYRSVPAYPPPAGTEPGVLNHRRRDATRLVEPEHQIGPALDVRDWQVERRELEGGSAELVFTLETPDLRLRKRVRALPGERHMLIEVEAEPLSDKLTGHDLHLRIGTGGGILRVSDRYYPNPYVAAAKLEHGVVDKVERLIPRGRLIGGRRDAAARWSGEFAFVNDGSKYFLGAIRPLDGPFQGAVAEILYDHYGYEDTIRAGLEPDVFERMVEIARVDAAVLKEKGRPASGEELAAETGLDPAEAARLRNEYYQRAQDAAKVLWNRASVYGAFTLHVGRPGDPPAVRRFQWFLGPKDPAILASSAYHPLDAIITDVDYGGTFFYDIFLTRYIAYAILWFLKVFYFLFGNWGVSIILMTVLVRVSLFPINRHSQVKMAHYQVKAAKVKPLLDGIKKKYADNPQKKNEETMKVYQQHKLAPPLGGCLPMFLQFPIFIGLFAALRCSILLRQEPFFGWIRDLSRPDALIDFHGPVLHFWPMTGVTTLNILPILMVVLWVAHQKSMPKPIDPQQAQMQKMMTFMPILFGLLLYNYAAGLSLYMITSSSLGIFESKVIKKRWPVPTAASAVASAKT